MADKILTTDQLLKELAKYKYKQLHIHHTWKPTHKDFNGSNHLALNQAMRNYHMKDRGWKDIGQHLTLCPDGKWVTGRPFNQTPASIAGWNTGALAVEMIGNFDKPGTGVSNSSGYDILKGKQKDSVLALIKYYGKRFGYDGVKFHREGPGAGKTCPGTSLNKATMIAEAKGTIPKGDDSLRYGVVLKRGIKGAEVALLQKELVQLGYSVGKSGVDGSFGADTEKAVKAFQKANKLAVDGSVGPATQAKIDALLSPSKNDYKAMYEAEKKKRAQAEGRLAAIKQAGGW